MVQEIVEEGPKIEYSDADVDGIGIPWYTAATLVEIDDCDAITNFSAQVGSGAFSLDQTLQAEGIGCVKFNPSVATCVIKTTVAAKDLSGCNNILLHIRRDSDWVESAMTLYFGESAYNEQSKVISVPNKNVWYEINWDISGIGAGNKDAVTIFAIGFVSLLARGNIYIDYIRAIATESIKIRLPSGIKTFTIT